MLHIALVLISPCLSNHIFIIPFVFQYVNKNNELKNYFFHFSLFCTQKCSIWKCNKNKKLMSFHYSAICIKNYIKKDLMQKGIKQGEIENIISNLPSGEGVAKQFAKKWIKNKTLPLDQKDKAKLYRFLAGKGFDFEEIKSATKDLNMESNDDWC